MLHRRLGTQIPQSESTSRRTIRETHIRTVLIDERERTKSVPHGGSHVDVFPAKKSDFRNRQYVFSNFHFLQSTKEQIAYLLWNQHDFFFCLEPRRHTYPCMQSKEYSWCACAPSGRGWELSRAACGKGEHRGKRTPRRYGRHGNHDDFGPRKGNCSSLALPAITGTRLAGYSIAVQLKTYPSWRTAGVDK